MTGACRSQFDGRLAACIRPALKSDGDVSWIEFNRSALSFRPLASDDRRAAAAERLVNEIARIRVVSDWTLHALNRLLRTVPRLAILRLVDLP